MISKVAQEWQKETAKTQAVIEKMDKFYAALEEICERIEGEGKDARVSIWSGGVSMNISGFDSEFAQDLCGQVKSIAERLGYAEDVKWKMIVYENWQDLDYETNIDCLLVRLSTKPTDCEFVVDHYEERPVYRLKCKGGDAG